MRFLIRNSSIHNKICVVFESKSDPLFNYLLNTTKPTNKPRRINFLTYLKLMYIFFCQRREQFNRIYTGCSKKTLFYVFAYISANTYRRETSWISTELGGLEVSIDMRFDFLRYLVHEKIYIL